MTSKVAELENLKEFFDNSLQGLLIIRNQSIIFANQTFAELSGYSVKEILSLSTKELRTLIHPEDVEPIYKNIDNNFKGKTSQLHLEFRLIRKDESIRWLKMSSTRIKYGENFAVQMAFIDITERKRLENVNSTLLKISRAVHSTKNLDDLFVQIHKALSAIIDTTNFYVALYDKENKILNFPYFVDESNGYKSIRIDDPGSLTAKIIRTGKPILVTVDQYKKWINKEKIKRWGNLPKIRLGVPLRIMDDVIGVVAVQSYNDRTHYSEKDIGIMESVSEHIAVAIERRQLEDEKKKYIDELKAALTKIKTLKGLIPICASCKKIRNDKGFWDDVESYVMKHADVTFSHGICPDCMNKLYPDYMKNREKKKS